MSFRESTLTPVQARVLAAVGRLAKDKGFYLAGGTAIALYLGHRRSEDFDWFAPAFGQPDALTAAIAARGLVLEVDQIEPGTVIGRIEDVKVSFFQYRYPLLDAVGFWPKFGIDIASVRDLQAMKLLAVAQRGSRKDFIDIHGLLRHGVELAAMLRAFDAKFEADRISVLRGLAYFDDAETEPMPEMLNATDWKDVRDDIIRALREVVA